MRLGQRMPDPTYKARMAYARSIRRGSRKHVTAEVFKASVAEAIAVVKPPAVIVATPKRPTRTE